MSPRRQDAQPPPHRRRRRGAAATFHSLAEASAPGIEDTRSSVVHAVFRTPTTETEVYEYVTEHLKAAGSAGGGGSWQCPAHDDNAPSLSVNHGRKGVVMTCHAGCELGDILDAIGLEDRDLFYDTWVSWRRDPAPATGSLGRIVANYPYVDENGELLFEVVRYEPKTFRQRRPDGHGGWSWRLGDVRRVLYRLPDVLRAVGAGETVWIVEGEKDADALIDAGVTATTAAQGAGKWRPEYAEALAGATVRVVADRDAKGYEHARQVAASLTAAGCAVEVVEAAEGKDAADHLAAGHGLDDFRPVDLDQVAGTDDRLEDEEPAETGDRPWPELDPAALHGPAGEVVRLLDPHTEADPAAVLVTFLAMFGAVVGSGPHARAGHAKHPARIYPVIPGRSSKARKGTSWHAVRLIFDRVDGLFLRTRLMNGFGSGEALIDEVKDPDQDDEKDKGARDKRLLLHEPEFAKLLRICNREGSTLSGHIRDAWDGYPLQSRTRGHGKVIATGHHIVVVGHITVAELRRNLSEVELANGFANRFLWVCARRTKLLPFDSSPDPDALDALAGVIRDRIRQARTAGTIQFTEAGRERWAELYKVMADDDPGGLLGAVTARPEPQTLRLALLYALLDGERLIDVPHLDAAWAVWRYCRASAVYVWGDLVGGDPLADRLYKAIKAAGERGLTKTEVRKAAGSNTIPTKHINDVLGELERQGLIESDRDAGPGRPKTVYRAVS